MGAIDFSLRATTAHNPTLVIQVVLTLETDGNHNLYPLQRVFFGLDTAGTGLSGPNRPNR